MTMWNDSHISAHLRQAFEHAVRGSSQRAIHLIELIETLQPSDENPMWAVAVVKAVLAAREGDSNKLLEHIRHASQNPLGESTLRSILVSENTAVPIIGKNMIRQAMADPKPWLREWIANKTNKYVLVSAIVLACTLTALISIALRSDHQSWFAKGDNSLQNSNGTNLPGIENLQEATGQVVLRLRVILKSGNTIWFPLSRGSAFFIARDGLLLTNRHVIDGGDEWVQKDNRVIDWDLEIRGLGGSSKTFKARVIHSSRYLDIAVLKIDFEFDDPPAWDTNINAGETVTSLGYPGAGQDVEKILNPQATLTKLNKISAAVDKGDDVDTSILLPETPSLFQGIISAIRSGERGQYIQTDAAIQPGMSGGPLINQRGKVVGLITWKHGSVEGMGQAISMVSVKKDIVHIDGMK